MRSTGKRGFSSAAQGLSHVVYQGVIITTPLRCHVKVGKVGREKNFPFRHWRGCQNIAIPGKITTPREWHPKLSSVPALP